MDESVVREDDDSDDFLAETSAVQSINSRDPTTECTLLHLVVSHNTNPLEPLRLLLSHGADATARNIYNVQAIHVIFLKCPEPLESIRLLLEHDADPNARDGDGWTSVHYAARFCRSPKPVLEALIEAGADVDLVDASKKTALFALLANGDHSKTLDWLIHTVKANVKTKGDFLDIRTRRTIKGSLVLQAAKYGRLSSLRILISSALAMDSLESILTHNELTLAIDLIKEQLLKVTETESTERLGLMMMIIEKLDRRLFAGELKEDSVLKKPSLLKRAMPWRHIK
ncbi:Ankyrin repeat domain-containing protein 54 [Choanephora cucurbitarum]|uniref:Ankyrin repeat domain-containing protein 54 n=1 Tax=Choanephora cucurbitarum TaxID=101091 RepID=A0A1C7N000_9FUNG|nr:Ankyrin repeat domain-containing protein 54 [Choanephora cucurbitarum]